MNNSVPVFYKTEAEIGAHPSHMIGLFSIEDKQLVFKPMNDSFGLKLIMGLIEADLIMGFYPGLIEAAPLDPTSDDRKEGTPCPPQEEQMSHLKAVA